MKNHWVITRPKRKLILVPDMLKIFSAVAIGQEWRGNRELQKEFERQLSETQWKRENVSSSGSGGRTYATLLLMLGLWFEDENGVQITNAGQEILDDDPPVPIITKQLLDFQYPSPYSLISSVNISPDFRLRPHRLIVRLFTEKGITELTQDEVAFCLVPFAKKDDDLDLCSDMISKFRQNPDPIKEKAVQKSGATADNLKNIGNTAINQLEYTGWFDSGNDEKSIKIKPDKVDDAKKAVANSRESLIQEFENIPTFQMRYGKGIKTQKDYRYTKATKTSINPNERAILLSYYEMTLNTPIKGITTELIQKISELRGAPVDLVQKVLSQFAEKPLMDRFEERYLQLSVGGTETATDFEVKTNGVFSDEGFGLVSVWVGPKPRHPDLFIFFDKENQKHGIIDAKAYKEYHLPLDHKNKMAHTYIPNFRKITYENVEYDLSFFSYVAGGYGSNMHRSFRELTTMTDVKGSYITAMNLLKLLKLHRSKPFSKERFGEIFAMNKEIKYEEIV